MPALDLEQLAKKTHETFAALLLYRDFHGSGDGFQSEFDRTIAHLRQRAATLAPLDSRAGAYFNALADALERWNYGEVRTKATP